jgi:tRNA pseudouridine13 synthase
MTIRRQPSDFIVEEMIDPAVSSAWTNEPGPDGPRYAVYRLHKRSLTTPEATSRLAGALKVKPSAVVHAGLKDKHAQTSQHVSVAVDDPAAADALPERGELDSWRFERVGWSNEPASPAWIRANRFEIVVRDLTRAASDEMERAARAMWLSAPGGGVDRVALGVVNYFGDQRFGSARHGEGFAARRLVDGDFEGALELLLASPHRKDTGAWREFTRTAAGLWGSWKKLAKQLPARPERAAIEALAAGASGAEAFARLPHFLQDLCVDAYQSHLWNACVRELVRERCTAKGSRSVDVIEREDDFGAMVFPGTARAGAGLAGLRVPIPGPRTALAEPWGHVMRRVLDAEGLSVDRLKIPGLRRPSFGESWRDVVIEARAFELTGAEPDELCTRSPAARRGKRTARFELPSGAYATVVLRMLGQ